MSENKTKLPIVARILKALGLGDEGKISAFFGRIVKTLEREISALSKNIDTEKFNATAREEELQDQLEDAQAALAEAYLQVSPEQVATNELQKAYMETYLTNIAKHKRAVKAIEDKIADNSTNLKAAVSDLEDQIAERKETIKEIKG